MRIILKTFKWILVSLIIIGAVTAAFTFSFIYSRDFRQNFFPIDYKWNEIEIKCNDLAVTAVDTAHLKEITVVGPGFRLSVPDVELEYENQPPRLRKVLLISPRIDVHVAKGGKRRSVPFRTISQAAKVLHVRNGTVHVAWQNGKAEITHLDLAPSVQDRLCTAVADYHVTATGAEIDGKASASLMVEDYRLLVHTEGVTAHFPGFRPVNLAADAETALDNLLNYRGTVSIKDVLAFLPPSLDSLPAISERIKKVEELPAEVNFRLTIPDHADLNGTIEVPLALFPERFAPAQSPVAAYRVVLESGYRSGAYRIDIPGIGTAFTGRFSNLGKKGVKWSLHADSDVQGYSCYIDDNHAIEGLSGKIAVDARGIAGAGRHPLSWSIRASWNHGDLLIYPWYFDLSSSASGKFHALGRVNGELIEVEDAGLSSFSEISVRNIRLSMGPFIKKLKADPLRALKTLVSRQGDIFLSGPIGQNYQLLVREPFSAGHAILSEIDPTGDFKVRLNSLGADISLNADISWKEEQVVEGLKFRGIVPLEGKVCNACVLTWDRLSIPAHITKKDNDQGANLFNMDKGRLDLRACRDRIIFGEVEIPAGNGTITVSSGELEYDTGNLKLSDVKIDDVHLSTEINGNPVQAVLWGKRLQVELKEGRISVHGTVNTKFAKGNVRISGMWIEFSGPVPRFGADIEFRGIDIATLTELTDFGRITGILDGKVKGLVISGHQPESFDLEIRSRKSRDQEISIKAIRNLSILGGGGGGIPLLGQFFKNFSYSSIAVSCRLKNDIFTMHGLIKEGGAEYLVKRGFWGGVNVINQNPGGKISFSDMLERLARITKSGKATVE